MIEIPTADLKLTCWWWMKPTMSGEMIEIPTADLMQGFLSNYAFPRQG